MKVDALLSSQPKGEARVEYGFADDRYRYSCFCALREAAFPGRGLLNGFYFFLGLFGTSDHFSSVL